MIRSAVWGNYKPNGFIAIFSTPFMDKTSETLRMNVLTTHFESSKYLPFFNSDYLGSNNLYHRMKQNHFNNISIVNVWFVKKEDTKIIPELEKGKFVLNVKLNKDNYVNNKFLETHNDPGFKIEVFNFHYEDFFDLDVFFNTFYDQNRQFLFFFHTDIKYYSFF